MIAAHYFMEPNIVSTNNNRGGGGVGAALGGAIGGLFGGSAGSVIGGVAGGISVKKGEANVTLRLVNAAPPRKKRSPKAISASATSPSRAPAAPAGGAASARSAAAVQNTEIGQIIVLAYLDAYKKLVTQLGGQPMVAVAPPAQ